MRPRMYKSLVVLVCVSVMMFGVGCARKHLNENPETVEPKQNYDTIYKLSEADTNVSMENAEEIIFEKEQDVYAIQKAGDYLLRGEHKGQIQVDVQDEVVHLILDNVEMESVSGPVIYVESASKVVITIPEGSVSNLTDSAYYDSDTNAKACIYSESDLTFNGGGSLQVHGYYKDAIRTKDVLKLLDINLAVEAKNNGLRGNDGVVIQTKELEIQCEGTGIYTEKKDKENQGFVDIGAGTVVIIAGEYGVQAAENIYIHDCKADVYGIIENLSCEGELVVEEGCLE